MKLCALSQSDTHLLKLLSHNQKFPSQVTTTQFMLTKIIIIVVIDEKTLAETAEE